MTKEKKTDREIIVEKLKELSLNSLVEIVFANSPCKTCHHSKDCPISNTIFAINVVKDIKRFILTIYSKDSTNTILLKISKLEVELAMNSKIIEHQKQSPILFDYLAANILFSE